jgi:hypothetical protein
MPDGEDDTSTRITELVGVYHANGTFAGEVSYWLKARLGQTHCALCDITHGAVREKGAWRACRTQLPVPFTTVHLDERDPNLAALTEHRTPCVAARTDTHGLVLLVEAAELRGCDGSPECLVELIQQRAAEQGLTLRR